MTKNQDYFVKELLKDKNLLNQYIKVVKAKARFMYFFSMIIGAIVLAWSLFPLVKYGKYESIFQMTGFVPVVIWLLIFKDAQHILNLIAEIEQ